MPIMSIRAGYVAARWARPRGIPLVITSHGCDIAPDSRLMAKREVPDRVAFVLRSASALVSINDSVERVYRRHCAEANHIVSIPNGVDLAAFGSPVPRPSTIPERLQPEEFCVFLGRLVHRKGGDQLLLALCQIADSILVQLVIAGTGEEELALKTQAIQLGLADRVHFMVMSKASRRRTFCRTASARSFRPGFGGVVAGGVGELRGRSARYRHGNTGPGDDHHTQ